MGVDKIERFCEASCQRDRDCDFELGEKVSYNGTKKHRQVVMAFKGGLKFYFLFINNNEQMKNPKLWTELLCITIFLSVTEVIRIMRKCKSKISKKRY